jgi:hypothetical protein
LKEPEAAGNAGVRPAVSRPDRPTTRPMDGVAGGIDQNAAVPGGTGMLPPPSSWRLDQPGQECARCDDQAEATALVSARGRSFRVDLCMWHMEEVLAGARAIRS